MVNYHHFFRHDPKYTFCKELHAECTTLHVDTIVTLWIPSKC